MSFGQNSWLHCLEQSWHFLRRNNYDRVDMSYLKLAWLTTSIITSKILKFKIFG
jgi:hypothetical protein